MFRRPLLLAFLLLAALAPIARAGGEAVSPHLRDPSELDAPSFEMSVESSYMFGTFGNPNSYEVNAEFITARWRWGVIRDGWMRGYNQFYFLGMVEPIIRGPENIYGGISTGFRYNFLPIGSRWQPYISGGVGLGWIDSHANVFGAQGQDFTFNILSAVGVSYRVNDHLKITAGALYQHLSNAAQTDPNPSLNLFGPQVGVTYSF